MAGGGGHAPEYREAMGLSRRRNDEAFVGRDSSRHSSLTKPKASG
jgi:hypothetical protein